MPIPGRRKDERLTGTPGGDRLVKIQQERSENVPHGPVDSNQKQIDARHSHEQQAQVLRVWRQSSGRVGS